MVCLFYFWGFLCFCFSLNMEDGNIRKASLKGFLLLRAEWWMLTSRSVLYQCATVLYWGRCLPLIFSPYLFFSGSGRPMPGNLSDVNSPLWSFWDVLFPLLGPLSAGMKHAGRWREQEWMSHRKRVLFLNWASMTAALPEPRQSTVSHDDSVRTNMFPDNLLT